MGDQHSDNNKLHDIELDPFAGEYEPDPFADEGNRSATTHSDDEALFLNETAESAPPQPEKRYNIGMISAIALIAVAAIGYLSISEEKQPIEHAAKIEKDKPDSAATASTQTEMAKVEAAKVEAAKVEAAKVEAAKVEAAKVEAAKVEAAKVEAAKVEAAKVEAAKVEAAKVEAAKVEAAKVEAAKVEAAKVEAAKVEAAKVEAAKVEAAKVEAEKTDKPVNAMQSIAPASADSGSWVIYLSSASSKKSALQQVARIKASAIDVETVPVKVKGRTVHRIKLQRMLNREDAELTRDFLAKKLHLNKPWIEQQSL